MKKKTSPMSEENSHTLFHNMKQYTKNYFNYTISVKTTNFNTVPNLEFIAYISSYLIISKLF